MLKTRNPNMKETQFIKISKEDFDKKYSLEDWLIFERRLEKQLEKTLYQYEIDATKNSLIVYVQDKNDALKLFSELGMRHVLFFDGRTEEIISRGIKAKRQRISVENEEGKTLSIKQFKKETISENDLIRKSEVIKLGIFKKAELEKILRSGALLVENFDDKQYLNRTSIKEYLTNNTK